MSKIIFLVVLALLAAFASAQCDEVAAATCVTEIEDNYSSCDNTANWNCWCDGYGQWYEDYAACYADCLADESYDRTTFDSFYDAGQAAMEPYCDGSGASATVGLTLPVYIVGFLATMYYYFN